MRIRTQPQGGQRLLVEALKTTFDVEDWSLDPAAIRHVAKECRAQLGRGVVVADFLERIRVAEMLLAPAARLFMLLLGCDGQSPRDVSMAVRKQWGPRVASVDPDAIEAIRNEFVGAEGEQASSDRWLQLAHAPANGNYDVALPLLIDQNRGVMVSRFCRAMGRASRRQASREVLRRQWRAIAHELLTAFAMDQLLLYRLPAHGGDAVGGTPCQKRPPRPFSPTSSNPL